MSHFDSQFADGAAQLADDLADVVSYTPAGGESFDMSIIVGPEEVIEVVEQDGIKRNHTRECSVPATAQAAGGGAFLPEPTMHDVFNFNGEDYIVKKIIARTASMTRISAVRMSVHEGTRRDLRRRN